MDEMIDQFHAAMAKIQVSQQEQVDTTAMFTNTLMQQQEKIDTVQSETMRRLDQVWSRMDDPKEGAGSKDAPSIHVDSDERGGAWASTAMGKREGARLLQTAGEDDPSITQ